MTEPLTRSAASAAVEDLGWRLVLGRYLLAVAVPSLAEGLTVATTAAAACGDDADSHLAVDVRGDRVELALSTDQQVTARDAELAVAVHHALAGQDLVPPAPGGTRSVQVIEFAIDALDITAIRPFWKAVLGYDDENAPGHPEDLALVDPHGQGPSVWFQPMDEPRPQRNRIHLDLAVPHEEAERRLEAALAAGGTLVSDAAARAFWILADAEGNEICICTWQDREN